MESLEEFEIHKKIQVITVDNVDANTVFMHELKCFLEEKKIYFDSNDQHFRCFAHIINLGVQDILKLMQIEVDDNKNLCSDIAEDDLYEYSTDLFENGNSVFVNVIKKIRMLFKKLRKSEKLLRELNLLCEAWNIKYVKPILDVQVRWNSTHDMLEVSLKLKKCLIAFYDNHKEFNYLKLTENEWLLVEQIQDYLSHFAYVSTIISSDKTAVISEAVIALNMLLDKIEYITESLDSKIDRSSCDEVLLLAMQKGRDKILKHYDKCNWIYCIALVLDPRFKTEGFDKSKWGKEMKIETMNKFYEIYNKQYFGNSTKKNVSKPESLNSTINIKAIFKKKEINSNISELDKYLQSATADEEVEVLDWWKCHSDCYPTLAKMARDIFSILPTSTSVERLFSMAKLILRDNRTNLSEYNFKALLCINSWAKSNLKNQICDI